MVSGAAFAATDGSAGATSSGTSVVSLEITDRVQISNVKDIALGAYGGSGNVTGNASFCVFRNGGDDYKLTLTANTGNYLVTSGTTGDSIAFTAKVDADSDASDGVGLGYNALSANLAGSGVASCGGSDNAALHVTFAEAALQAVSTGNDYQATVTLLVTPI